MRLIYLKPKLKDLSQGSRIAFARQFRSMTQDDVSNRLGLIGECKRRTMARYEKGDRNPKEERILEIAKILNVKVNAIKKYDYKELIDVIYTLIWLEELTPNYRIDFSDVPNINNKDILVIKNFVKEWNLMKNKRLRRQISYKEYVEWKLNYEINGEVRNDEWIN